MDDQNTPSEPVDVVPTPPPADSAPAAVEPDSAQPTGSNTANTLPEAPESPINAPSTPPVEDQNPPINQPESDEPEQSISTPSEPQAPVDDQPVSEPTPETDEPPTSEPIQPYPVQSAPASAPTLLTPTAPQTQPSAQQNQTSFIRALLAKANAKLGSNRQKKLDKIMLTAQKKGFITNEEAQELLHCSDATATRYLSKLVQQGRLNRTDGSHWVKYLFVH
jgi:hypothetical protein